MCFIHYRLDIFYSLSLIGYLYQHGPCHTAIRLIRLYFLPACKFTIFFFISSSFVVFFILFVQTIVKQTSGTLRRRAEWSMEPKAQPWAMQPTGGKWNPSRLKILGFYLQRGGVIYYLCIQIAQGTSQYFSKTYHPFFLCYLKNMKNTARKTNINNMTSQWHTSTAWKEPVCYPDICIVSALWQTFDILTSPQGDCVSWWNTVPFLLFKPPIHHVLHHFLP